MQARVPLHVVRADARLEELVRRVGLLREPLAGAVEADRVRAVLRDRGLNAQRRAPSPRPSSPGRACPLAHERAQAAIRRAHDLREQEALQTEEAAVMVLAVALDREHLAVADADVSRSRCRSTGTRSSPTARPRRRGRRREAEPGEGRGGGGGLEEVAARGSMAVSREGITCRAGWACPLRRARAPRGRSSVPAPSRRRPSRRRRPPPPPGGSPGTAARRARR